MRVVVVGGTGNLGASLLRVLAGHDGVDSILGVARRRPRLQIPKTEWAEADVATGDLTSLFRSADAIVHLAWLIQPSRDEQALWRVNVEGSSRVFAAAAEADLRTLIYASSVGAYSAGPKDRLVDESWPVAGVEASFYSRHKAEVERRLDVFEAAHPDVRVVRMRPGLMFKREAAAGVRRLFAGPFAPGSALRPRLVPLFPHIPGLRFQAVHSKDAAEAFRLAILRDVRGAFNVAAEPVLDSRLLAEMFGARLARVPAGVARAAVSALWRLHLQPTPPGWLELGLAVPLLDTTRAREELGWSPTWSATQALGELIQGLREGAGDETPPLSPRTSGPARLRELVTGIGRRGGA
jgi:UDP-glucose 4-epimerase